LRRAGGFLARLEQAAPQSFSVKQSKFALAHHRGKRSAGLTISGFNLAGIFKSPIG
jgi:hypothetical protein